MAQAAGYSKARIGASLGVTVVLVASQFLFHDGIAECVRERGSRRAR